VARVPEQDGLARAIVMVGAILICARVLARSSARRVKGGGRYRINSVGLSGSCVVTRDGRRLYDSRVTNDYPPRPGDPAVRAEHGRAAAAGETVVYASSWHGIRRVAGSSTPAEASGDPGEDRVLLPTPDRTKRAVAIAKRSVRSRCGSGCGAFGLMAPALRKAACSACCHDSWPRVRLGQLPGARDLSARSLTRWTASPTQRVPPGSDRQGAHPAAAARMVQLTPAWTSTCSGALCRRRGDACFAGADRPPVVPASPAWFLARGRTR